MELTPNDVRFVVQRLPRDVRDMLSHHPRRLYVGGGFVRAVVAGETPNDIDVFGPSAEYLENVANLLAANRPGSKLHKSKNAITLLTPERMAVQFITRWTFEKPRDVIRSFDFTVCQAAVWRAGSQSNAKWESEVGPDFYVDLAGRRLVYTSPIREEEPGGSMLRVIKYVKRGYSIQVASLGAVIARLTSKVRDSHLAGDEAGAALCIAGLLREVDPLFVIDGFEIVDDHAPIEGDVQEGLANG